MRRITTAERRSRLGIRHRLAVPAPTIEQAVRDLVVLHATEPATVYLSARARVAGFDPGDLERLLYDDRTLIRVLAMRRTLFVAPVDVLPVILAAASWPLAEREHRRSARLIERFGIADDGDRWLRHTKAATVAALAARGEATASELAADVPELRRKMHIGAGTKWEGTQSVGSLVFPILSAEGAIARGRPRGTWLSSQHRWVPTEVWLGHGIDRRPTAEAQAELARWWLARFGPATVRDLKWWTGWTLTESRKALAAIGAVDVELDDGPGVVLPDDLDPDPVPDPWVALLPALDPTIMGWKDRDWYVAEPARIVYDSAGNAGPTVWCDGRVAGAWAIRDDGEVVHRLFEDIGADATAALDTQAAALSAWLADRPRPGFRSALERDIVGM